LSPYLVVFCWVVIRHIDSSLCWRLLCARRAAERLSGVAPWWPSVTDLSVPVSARHLITVYL
jgi:hypothetical protein